MGAYADGLYDVNRLRDRWYRDLKLPGIETEKEIVTSFDGSIGNPVMNVLKIFSENYEGDERSYIEKDGDEIVRSQGLLLVAHNSNEFDSWVVLNSLVKEKTELKIIETARGLIWLLFWCGVKIVNTCEVPQYFKFSCTKSQLEGSLEKIGKGQGLQSDLLKREMEHWFININNFADLRHFWELYLKIDVLCWAFIYATQSMEMQNVSGCGIEECSTEASLGWKCFGT